MSGRIPARLQRIAAALGLRHPEQPGRMSSAELDAALDQIATELQRQDDELRATIGEEAFAAVLIEREQAAASRETSLRTSHVQPEWRHHGFDLASLTDVQIETLLLFEADEIRKSLNESDPNAASVGH